MLVKSIAWIYIQQRFQYYTALALYLITHVIDEKRLMFKFKVSINVLFNQVVNQFVMYLKRCISK